MNDNKQVKSRDLTHPETAIRLENLTKAFVNKKKKDVPPVIAVNQMDVTIESGKLIGLLGPSGCGKSTTLFMIAGLHEPTEGSIHFVWEDEMGMIIDEDVTQLSPENRGIGLVFQNYALYPHMTVAENIMFPLGNFKGEEKIDKNVQYERAQEMADLVGIGDLMDRKPGELSGGQQQRVAIARALVKMPKVLLLDEPLSNLDARLRLQTREEIRRIQQETGITTVFVTHDQEEAMSISDQIIVMDKGVVQQIGAPQEVYENPVNEFVAKFLGTPPINMFKAIYKKDGIHFTKDVAVPLTDKEFKVLQDKAAKEYIAGVEAERKAAKEAAVAKGKEVAAQFTGEIIVPELDVPTFKIVVESQHVLTTKIKGLAENTEINIGVRPDGYIVDEKGTLELEYDFIERIGRDQILVITHDHGEKPLRLVISSDINLDKSKVVKFSLNPKKVYGFDKTTGERLF
ncbi:MAG TPA: ABC transporter ATP-binding protein [Haploplasma sp.]|nr:ABC transporter ATP-binding protein [Haploplasma sp.]